MQLINKAIVKILSRKGYLLTPKTEKKRLEVNDYSQTVYSRGNFFFNIKSKIACNFNQFFFDQTNWHYHTKMVEDIINNGNVKYKGSILEKYYSTYKPYTFKDLYFINQKPIISDKQDSRILNENLNYYKYDLWSDERQKVQMDRVHEYGLLRSHGTQHFGPVSIQKGELELQRLKDTYHSILKYGHLPNKFGFISGYFLRYKNRYRFIILDGNHRAAVLCAMGYSKIPVTFQAGFPRIIDYNDIKNFPHVKRGLFSLPLAKQIFKTYFEDDGTKKARNLGLIN